MVPASLLDCDASSWGATVVVKLNYSAKMSGWRYELQVIKRVMIKTIRYDDIRRKVLEGNVCDIGLLSKSSSSIF